MREIFSETTWYGDGGIVRRYSGYPTRLPLPVSIQHGWTIAAAPGHAVKQAPEKWYWSVAAEQRYAAAYPDLATQTSGASFLYLLRASGYIPLAKAEQKGSIVFPSHSTRRIDMACDFDQYAAALAALPMAYHPITVHLYYVDCNRGLAEPFLRHGMAVVTNGQSHLDDDFLWNFVRNVHGNQYIFSNQLSSALLFGVAMDLTAHFSGPEFQVLNPNQYWRQRDYNQHHRTWEAQYREVFGFPDPDLTLQKQAVDEELGRAKMLSPGEMRRLLWRLTFHPKYLQQLRRSWMQNMKQAKS